MWAKQQPVALIVLPFFIVIGCIACGGTPITAETADRIEQPVEPPSTGTIKNNPESTDDDTTPNEDGVESSNIGTAIIDTTAGSSTTTSTSSTIAPTTTISVTESTTTIDATTTTVNRVLSPAWVEANNLASLSDSDVLENIRQINNYYSENPNSIATPMGALCWSYHELNRTHLMSTSRNWLDHHLVPFLIEEYGLTSEQVGPPGPESTDNFFDLMRDENGPVGFTDTGSVDEAAVPNEDGDIGPVGSVNEDKITEDETLEYFRAMHEFAGDGNTWAVAVQTVASPEMTVAFNAGEGLSATVRVYADALIAFAKEHVGKAIDPSNDSDNLDFVLPGFPGIEAFIEEAKYHQDCKRALIGDLSVSNNG